MATKKQAPRSRKAIPATKHLVHEFNDAGQHRIVVLTDGVPDQSAWFERREVAHFKGLLANANHDMPLPHGIFRVSTPAFARLSAKRYEATILPAEKSDSMGGLL